MPRIILVRPGETDYHTHKVILGRQDTDLNETGRRQANQIACALERYDISQVAVSPLKRAISTAMTIEDICGQPPVHPVAGFNGMDIGDWENLTVEEVSTQDSSRYQSFLADPDFRAPGGECLREVYARAFPDLVNMVHHAEADETLVMVLQEQVLQALCCGILDLPLAAACRFDLDQGAYATFERLYPEGPYKLKCWNCQSRQDYEWQGLELAEETAGY